MTAVSANKACIRLAWYCRRQSPVGEKKSAKREAVKVAKCEGSKTVGAVCGQLGGGAQDIHYQRIDPRTLLLYIKFAPSTPVLSLYKYREPKVVHVMTQSKDPMQNSS
jgi:hypothetical protein